MEVVRGFSLGAVALTGVEEVNPVAPSISRAGTDTTGLEVKVRDGVIVLPVAIVGVVVVEVDVVVIIRVVAIVGVGVAIVLR